MKKVLLCAYACSPIRGSEPGNGWNWAFYLALRGYKVWCLTNIEDKDVILKELEKHNLPNLKFIFVNLPYNLDDKLLNTSSKTIYFHYFIWQRIAYKVALKLHNVIHFDVAHHVTFGSLQQGTFLSKLKNVKIIFGPVGGGQKAMPAFKEYFGQGWKTEHIRSIISNLSLNFSFNLKETIRKSDYILVTNKDTQDLIKKFNFYQEDKVHLILDNAVPPSMQSLTYVEKVDTKKIKLLWVGRMLPRKGLKLVLHALSYLPEFVNYSLTVVGGGEQFALLDKWIKEYNLNSSRLEILGQIPFSNVLDCYHKSDVFIFCSLRDSCPAQLNEAMAFGLPIITLNIHGSALAVPDNCGIKVLPTTKDLTALEISKAIVKYYSDLDFRKSASINAYMYAQNNTWENKIDLITSRFYER